MPQIFAWIIFAVILVAAVLMLCPPYIAVWVLILPLLLLPAGLVSGMVYGRGLQRAVAIGAAVSAVTPLLSTMLTLPFGLRGFYFRGGSNWLFPILFLMTPFFAGLAGGLTAYLLLPRVRRRSRRRPLQFKLSTLLWGMTVISVYFGIVSAAPMLLVAVVFGFAAASIPAALVTGIIYGRSRVRTFCIGGAAAGLIPQCVGFVSILASAAGDFRGGYAWEARVISSVALLGPPAVIAAGGFLALWVRRRLEHARVTFGAPKIDVVRVKEDVLEANEMIG